MVVVSEDGSTLEAKWIGERITVQQQPSLAHLAHRPVSYYTKCIFGALTLRVGDFVLVSNVDAAEPDTVDGCDVARIVHLYELCDVFEKEPYRAVVQWYSRPHSIPHKEFDTDNILINFDIEVIEDHRLFDCDISLETIYQRCRVVRGNSTSCADALLAKSNELIQQQQRQRLPVFVCRYKYVQLRGGKRFHLVPLEYMQHGAQDDGKNSSGNQRIKKLTQSASKTEATGAATAGAASRRVQPKRRASMYISYNSEFIDMESFNQNKVSPIKIVGGRSVVRVSAKKAKPETPASPLTERNVRVTPTQRAAARRNLNLSLDKEANTTTGSDCLNYSIVGSTVPLAHEPAGGEIKIKLRLSDRQRARRLSSDDNDPLDINGADVDTLVKQLHRKRVDSLMSSTPTAGVAAVESDPYHTPTKKSKDTEMTPSNGRRKSILKSATRRLDDGTPRRSIQLSNIVEQRIFQEDAIISTPKRGRKQKLIAREDYGDDNGVGCTPKKSNNSTAMPTTPTAKSTATTPTAKSATTTPKTTTPRHKKAAGAETPVVKAKRVRAGDLEADLVQREHKAPTTPKSDLQMAREQLHVSVVPQSLPCREKEFEDIYNFLECKIRDQCGGCMYVSGVPGTGKTATVTSVIRTLQAQCAQDDELEAFDFLEINGMRLTEPRQAYVQIYKQLTGKTVAWEHAHALLEKRFSTAAPRRVTTVLLVDELDILCNRRQDVVYNLLDWPTKLSARLVVVTIANTMDLPERLLMGKVTSRLGLTRLTFQPYTYQQLESIVVARLSGSDAFKGEAVQLVARKVAAVSGDARRALDICRRATEVADAAFSENTSAQAERCVTIVHVQQALAEMIASAKVQAIKNCSRLEQMFLQAVVAEVTRTGVEETNFIGVYTQLESIAGFEGVRVPAPGRCLRICSKLGSERLLIGEHSRNDLFQKILLNVSTDDIHYALQLHANANLQ